jgi:hypothetical protein
VKNARLHLDEKIRLYTSPRAALIRIRARYSISLTALDHM